MSYSRFPIPSPAAIGAGLIEGILLGFILMIPQAGPALAAGNLRLGPVELHPFFQLTESYDDNVCKRKEKECLDPKDSTKKDGSDLITIFSPGIQIHLPVREHEITADYRADLGRYSEFKSENYSDQTARGRIGLNFPGGLSLSVREEWKAGHDPRGFAQNEDLDFFRHNTAAGEVGIKVGPKLRLAARYAHFVLNYEDNARNGFRDRTDNTVGGSIYFKFLPKTSAVAEYDYTTVQFKIDNPGLGSLDSTAHRGLLGLTWEVTSRSTGTIKGGYTRKDFDEVDTEFKGGVVSIGLAHELGARTLLRLDSERAVRESNILTQPYYVSLNSRLELEHQIRGRWLAHLRGGYSRDQYPGDIMVGTETKERLDNTWVAGVGLDYRIPDLFNAGLRYDHTQRTSAFDVFDYSDNLYAFTIGIIL